jgi:hypothetical protein
MQGQELKHLDSSTSIHGDNPKTFPAWIKVGAIAAASALAGGIAAAWFYRKTIEKLREAGSEGENPESGISDSETEDDL